MEDKIESIIRKKTKEDASFKYSCKELFTKDATERRIRAARYFSPILKERYGEKYSTLDWDEEAAKFSSMCTIGPDELDGDGKLLYGASIYILDAIFNIDLSYIVLSKLDKLLPPDSEYEEIDDLNDYFFFDRYDEIGDYPYYSKDLLLLVTRVLSHRNSDFVTYEKKNRGCLYLLDKATVSFDEPKPIEDNKKTRERYNKLISLIPQNYIKEAKEAFISLFWSMIDNYLESRAKMKKQREKLENIIEYGKIQFQERAIKHLESNQSSFFGKSPDTTLGENLAKMAELEDCEMDFDEYFCVGMYDFPSCINRYTRGFDKIAIDDPYKIIAGYFFLLEEKNDYAWLLGPAVAALATAVNLLPWKIDFAISDNSWDRVDIEKKKRELHSSAFYKINLKGEQFGIKDYKHNMNPSQLLYCFTNTIPPRTIPTYPFINEFESKTSDKALVKECVDSYILLHSHSEKMESNVNDADTSLNHIKFVEELEKEVLSLQTEISDFEKTVKPQIISKPVAEDESKLNKLENEINRLQKDLDREKHYQKRMLNEKSNLEKQIKEEREELYSLRELIFSRENEEEENTSSSTKNEVSFPINTKMRHVVVGGHEEWLKKIKAMLPDVIFLGDRAPSKEVLKHTDVLWFQTHAGLSHSIFYKIIEDAKNLKVPIKYFTSSSSKGNAIQLYEEDQNRSR